jgi:pimeloyl-ACP methyl ester carboxylesterase
MIKRFKNGLYDIAYITQGKGRDILFLHGFPSNMYMWDEITGVLSHQDYRTTVIEQRGYPLSSSGEMKPNDFTIDKLSEDVEILIKNLDLSNKLTIVGHDWGTVVAWALVKRNRVHVEKLLSICGGTLFPSSKVYDSLNYIDGNHYITSFQIPEKAAILMNENIRNSILGAYRTKNKETNASLSINSLFNDINHDQYALTEKQIDNITSHYKANGFYGPISWYANLDENIEISKKWINNKVSQEITFMFGEKDLAVMLNEKMIERLTSEADLVKIKEISGAGHWLPYTHKESVLNEIYSLNKDFKYVL